MRRAHLKSEDSTASRNSRNTAASASSATLATGGSTASFRTAATSGTSGTVGSSILRNLAVSMRNMHVGGVDNGGGGAVDVRGLQREVTDLRSDLDLMRANRQQEQRVYKLELHRLECEKSALEKRISVLLRDMNDKNAMNEYAILIKKAAPGTVDSTYVLKLQSQLAKAMHQMGVIQNQLTLTQQACDGIVEELRDEMRKITERNSKLELDYLNQIMKLQDENLDMKRQMEAMVIATDTEVITEEEDGEVEEENSYDAAPPVDGVVVKTSSKRRVGQSTRRTSEADASAPSRVPSSSSEADAQLRRAGGADQTVEEPPEPRHGQRKSVSSPRRSSQSSFDGERKPAQHAQLKRRSARSSSDGRHSGEDGESAPSSRQDHRKSSSRAKADNHSRSSEDHASARGGQHKSSSRSKVEDQHERSFGEGMVVKASSKSKSDPPRHETGSARRGDRPRRTSSTDDGGDVGGPVAKNTTRSSARRADRPRRTSDTDDGKDWVNFGNASMERKDEQPR